MIREITELLAELRAQLQQQDDFIARANLDPDERIFQERERVSKRITLLEYKLEEGEVLFDVREYEKWGL